MSLISDTTDLISVPLRDIVLATRNFKKSIGSGGYGYVYKAQLILSGKLTSVAVKRLNGENQGVAEFSTEIRLLSLYKHPNVITLLGYCQEDNEHILIYQYAENGSLDQYLISGDKTPLPWKQRLNICIDAARGLHYLHELAAANHRIIHRDVKSANILLDHSWKAMLSDFGLSKIGLSNGDRSDVVTRIAGTPGYIDPVYVNTGILKKESDVYSFGVMLFEALSGKHYVRNLQDEERFLANRAQTSYARKMFEEKMDLRLKDQLMDSHSMNMASNIAHRSLIIDPKLRPSIGLVVKKLEYALKFQEAADRHQEESEAIIQDIVVMMVKLKAIFEFIMYMLSKLSKKQQTSLLLLLLFGSVTKFVD